MADFLGKLVGLVVVGLLAWGMLAFATSSSPKPQTEPVLSKQGEARREARRAAHAIVAANAPLPTCAAVCSQMAREHFGVPSGPFPDELLRRLTDFHNDCARFMRDNRGGDGRCRDWESLPVFDSVAG